MRKTTPGMRRFANHLVVYEMAAEGGRGSTATAFNVCENLRPHLAILMGKVGVRALLSRALALAVREDAWLGALSVDADGSFAGLGAEARLDAHEYRRGGVILLAQVLGLLVSFIGQELTFRLMRDIWPKLSLEKFELGKET